MLCLSTSSLPEGPEWEYELKLDGYRAVAIKSGDCVKLRSRNDKDFTGRYPVIAEDGDLEIDNGASGMKRFRSVRRWETDW